MLERVDEGLGGAERAVGREAQGARRAAERLSLPLPRYETPAMGPGGAGESDSDLQEKSGRAREEEEQKRENAARDEQWRLYNQQGTTIYTLFEISRHFLLHKLCHLSR